jgi:hypothetical protein
MMGGAPFGQSDLHQEEQQEREVLKKTNPTFLLRDPRTAIPKSFVF